MRQPAKACCIALAIVALSCPAIGCLAKGPPDARAIIQRSVQASAIDWNAAPNYDYFERDQHPDGETKTYEILMIEGSPYRRLVAVNGRPLAPDRDAREQHALQEAVRQRQNESSQERKARVSSYEKERKRDRILMEQLTKAFDFTKVGNGKVDGREVCVLQAAPRSGYQPPNMKTEALKGMQGTLWIDKATFQWVKVDARVIPQCQSRVFLPRSSQARNSNWKRCPWTAASGFPSTSP